MKLKEDWLKINRIKIIISAIIALLIIATWNLFFLKDKEEPISSRPKKDPPTLPLSTVDSSTQITYEKISSEKRKLIELLNKAFADEWLAYFQYWIGAKIARGHIRPAVAAELYEHAKEELKHADMLAERIIQLGGVPLLSPQEWYKQTNCGFNTPKNELVQKILEQNLAGERCAIKIYKQLIETVKDKDHVTYQMIVTILSDEEKHESDIISLLQDIKIMTQK